MTLVCKVVPLLISCLRSDLKDSIAVYTDNVKLWRAPFGRNRSRVSLASAYQRIVPITHLKR